MLVQLNQIKKTYISEQVATDALKGINMNIQERDFLAIMGPSGCGKSTLLNIIGLLDIPTEGEVLFKGQKMSKLSERQRADFRKKHIGFIFQNFNLIDDLSVYENIELPLMYLSYPSKERKQIVINLMQELKIAHRASYYPRQLSGGQQQRVAICRALAVQPDLLLADEPTGNLDSQNSEEVMQILWRLNQQGTTIVMVTHSLQDAEYARHTVKLLDGQVVGRQQNQFLRMQN
ncbi:MAG: ABC transporter ATP-binding protein [Raineya sp.]